MPTPAPRSGGKLLRETNPLMKRESDKSLAGAILE
jgi:hypothetical protein